MSINSKAAATCATHGHLWGSFGKYIMCGHPAPPPGDPKMAAPLHGWRSWWVAAFMWLACRVVPPGYAIHYDLITKGEENV